MPYLKLDNAFLRLGDIEKAQRLADGFERADWVHVLDRYVIQASPPESASRSPSGAHGGHQSCGRRVLLREKTACSVLLSTPPTSCYGGPPGAVGAAGEANASAAKKR